MRIHILSDLHNEFEPYSPADVKADVVVLAGDIHSRGRSAQWALAHFDGPIVLVAGNHEYYNASLEKVETMLRAAAASSGGRLHYLQRDCVEIDGVRFLGATGWTDYTLDDSPAHAMHACQQMMFDHRRIRVGRNYRLWSPMDAQRQAVETRLWLERQLATPHAGKTVMVTHHAPIPRSLDPTRAPSSINAGYANTWEHLFGPQLALAIHGHTHHAVDYTFRGTRVVSNPLGYPGEGTGFNPRLIVEV